MALAIAVGFALLSVLLVVAQPWLGVAGGFVTSAVLWFGSVKVLGARQALTELRELGEDIRRGVNAAEADKVMTELTRLRAAEAAESVARAELDEAVAQVAGLRTRLDELDPARQWIRFVGTRADGDLYARHLGVISQVRKDFEELVGLLADWRANPGSDPTARPIDRIVLYVDDLDRCAPTQVLEVLEAVHLLLGMDLFVVVLGVDPRWLTRSLRERHASTLSHGSPLRPESYLEKVVTIPFVLPGIRRSSLSAILRSMAPVEADGPTPTNALEAADFLEIEPGAELDIRTRGRVEPVPHRALTRWELSALERLGPVLPTPRAVKRLLNVYRMIRSTRALSGSSDFLGIDVGPRHFEAVVVLLGIVIGLPDQASGICDALTSTDAATWGEFMDRMQDPEPLREISDRAATMEIEVFQEWAPRVRLFSYSLKDVS